jgi:hypothetical protein
MPDYVYISIETSGLEVKEERVVEIAALKINSKTKLRTLFHQYFNPQKEINASVSGIINLTNSFLKECPIIDKKINMIEKGYVSDFKKQLKKTKDKYEQEELLEFIKLYEKPTDIVERKVKELVPQAVIVKKVVKKQDSKAKDPIKFKTEPCKRDTSRLVFWCNPFESINKGKLGST